MVRGGPKLKRKIILGMSLLLMFIAIFPYVVQADDGNVGFSVQALIPENQLDKRKTYFDLRMLPGQEQTIEVVLHNNEPNEITVKTTVRNATTNRNGLVVYDAITEVDESLKRPLTETLKVEQEEILIPSGESRTIQAFITMPEAEYDGIILGGLHFEKVNEEDPGSETVEIQNKYVYVIGVQLSENDNEVEPELNFIGVEPKLVNHRTAVQATIQNPQPILMGNLQAEAQVYNKSGNKLIREATTEVNMAPNSQFEFVIDWENESLKPGDYVLKMKIADAVNEWEWDEPFTISKEAKLLNENAVEIVEDYTKWYWIGLGGLAFIIILLVLYIRKLKKRA